MTINGDLPATINNIFFNFQAPPKVFLYVSTAPSLQAWPNTKRLEQKLYDFYLQLLLRYGLAVVLTGCVKPKTKDARRGNQEKNRLSLHDFLEKAEDDVILRQSKISLAKAHSELLEDIEQVRSLLIELFPAEYGKQVNTLPAMLQFLACLHLAGNMPHRKIVEEIQAALKVPVAGVEQEALKLSAKLLKWGSSDYDDELNRLVSKDMNSNGKVSGGKKTNQLTWTIRAESRVYKLGRDLSRWLLTGAFSWARQQIAANKPVRILVIDPQLNPNYLKAKATAETRRLSFRLRDRLEINFKTLFYKDIKFFQLDVIHEKEGLLPGDSNHLGDSVVAFDRFLATKLVHRVRRVRMSDWDPAIALPSVKINSSRFSAWKFNEIAPGSQWSLWDYDVIFCEVGYDSVFAGPQVVQKLRSFFERTNSAKRRPLELLEQASLGNSIRDMVVKQDTIPAIIVQTRNADSEFIRQCLNLGAQAYVTKDRLFQMPARMCAAIRAEQNEAIHRAKAYKAGVGKERLGHRTNFRNLYALSTDRIAYLRRSDRPHLITGTEADREWLRQLPKADLHRHLGTSIRLQTIEALAFNTVGYLVTQYSDECDPSPRGGQHRDTHLDDAINHTLCALIAYAVFQKVGQPEKFCLGAPAQRLLGATMWVNSQKEKETRQENDSAWPPQEKQKGEYWEDPSPLDAVVRYLAPVGSPIRLYQAAGLAVAATLLLRLHFTYEGDVPGRSKKITEEIQKRWDYLQDVAAWRANCENETPETPDLPKEPSLWTKNFIDPAALDCYGQSLAVQFQPGKAFNASEYFRELQGQVSARICSAVDKMSGRIEGAKVKVAKFLVDEFKSSDVADKFKRATEEDCIGYIDDALAGGNLPSLADLVINRLTRKPSGTPPKTSGASSFEPTNNDFRKLGLERYLWGAGLLGAEHLQFPENLVLAAKDLVHQCAEECVTYSEVRCETPGYTVAGMSPAGATDLLLKSFDLASAYYRETGGMPLAVRGEIAGGVRDPTIQSLHGATFIRTNVLLAAKRHKKREDCARVVGLLERYLSNGHRVLEQDDPTIIPNWWKPCSVVGFDLSGNEIVDLEPLEKEIKRLFRYNSPITIHAGEAATAESIWKAVYDLHGRRIGHGLRLRESPKLLQYCIDEGICMEMCPVSNVLTYGFLPVAREETYRGLANEHYPLRYYMAAGLEVCINTDNRGLHQPVNQEIFTEGATITDDYLMAAKLSGGFSKWEVLKLVRAGFKHAFLSKFDISELISAVENRVYTLVARSPGLDWRAPPWPREDTTAAPEMDVD